MKSALNPLKWFVLLPKWRLRTGLLFLLLAGFQISAAERLTLNFDPDWKFIKSDPAGAAKGHSTGGEIRDDNWNCCLAACCSQFRIAPPLKSRFHRACQNCDLF